MPVMPVPAVVPGSADATMMTAMMPAASPRMRVATGPDDPLDAVPG
jgi:hypothetical protein